MWVSNLVESAARASSFCRMSSRCATIACSAVSRCSIHSAESSRRPVMVVAISCRSSAQDFFAATSSLIAQTALASDDEMRSALVFFSAARAASLDASWAVIPAMHVLNSAESASRASSLCRKRSRCATTSFCADTRRSSLTAACSLRSVMTVVNSCRSSAHDLSAATSSLTAWSAFSIE